MDVTILPPYFLDHVTITFGENRRHRKADHGGGFQFSTYSIRERGKVRNAPILSEFSIITLLRLQAWD